MAGIKPPRDSAGFISQLRWCHERWVETRPTSRGGMRHGAVLLGSPLIAWGLVEVLSKARHENGLPEVLVRSWPNDSPRRPGEQLRIVIASMVVFMPLIYAGHCTRGRMWRCCC